MIESFSSQARQGQMLVGLVLFLVASTGWAQDSTGIGVDAEPAAIEWSPHTGAAFDGSPLVGELGRIRVLENRGRADGPTIEIAFVRFRSDHPDPGPPIFFLAGGPGGSGIEGSAVVATHPQLRLLEQADVIGVDQRGTGASVPNLDRLPGGETVVERLRGAVDRDRLVRTSEAVAAATADAWRRHGVDLAAYNTRESADDLDAVRRALGLDRLTLWGASYGSHLGLAYLRRHGQTVERAVLAKVEGPDHTWKLPSTIDAGLDQVAEWWSSHPAAVGERRDLRARLGELLEGLATEPVVLQGVAEDGGSMVLGPLDVQVAVSRALASAEGVAELPARIERWHLGDWDDLLETARGLRHVEIAAMPMMMDCASGASRERWLRIERERRDPQFLLSDAIYAPFYPEVCGAAGAPDLGETFRGPLESPVPMLLVSGSLDVRTPSANVEQLLPGLPGAVHGRILHAGHPARELMSPEYRGLVQAFLRGERLEHFTIRLPRPLFERSEAVADVR